jgi:ParB family chromosome partitioning protein
MVRICDLQEFSGHPFKVVKDAAMYELMESIRLEGVLVPLLIRLAEQDGKYEIIAGHRRKMAAEWAGLTEVPAIVRNLDDDQAVIVMIDSNLQRERILPSEKAYAYKMRLEAMKHQGKRMHVELTSAQLEPKLQDGRGEGNESLNFKKAASGRSNELLAKQVGENVNQIKRYIRLTFLIPQILQMVDDEKLAITSAVEISFLKEEEQYELYAVMDLEQTIPSLSQANRMKRISQQKGLDMDKIYSILIERKPNQREQVKIPMDRIQQYFPKDFTPSQQIDLIEKLLAGWAEKYLKE